MSRFAGPVPKLENMPLLNSFSQFPLFFFTLILINSNYLKYVSSHFPSPFFLFIGIHFDSNSGKNIPHHTFFVLLPYTRAGNETVSSRKKGETRRDKTVSISSRIVTLSRETVSKLIFCLDRKNTAKTTKYFQHFVQNLAPYLPNLVSYLVSSRHFWSRDKTGETISRLVS